MLLSIAYSGALGETLFQRSIAASPYLPQQYRYDDEWPTSNYFAFAEAAGCLSVHPTNREASAAFDCLTKQDWRVLTSASQKVSVSGRFGTWGFAPVTDGDLLPDIPSKQLKEKKLNGRLMLTSNNADEGPTFTPLNITTEQMLDAWIRLTFPRFGDTDVAEVKRIYSNPMASTRYRIPFATTGTSSPNALTVGPLATGPQQTAFNIIAETTLVCPSYWLAEAYSTYGRKSWKFQYSVPTATHGADLAALIAPGGKVGPDLPAAFKQMWANFILHGDPSISAELANGASADNVSAENPMAEWPSYRVERPVMVNLNQSGGVEVLAPPSGVWRAREVVQMRMPGLRNDFSLVDARQWEGGRGERCDFWREVGGKVPA